MYTLKLHFMPSVQFRGIVNTLKQSNWKAYLLPICGAKKSPVPTSCWRRRTVRSSWQMVFLVMLSAICPGSPILFQGVNSYSLAVTYKFKKTMLANSWHNQHTWHLHDITQGRKEQRPNSTTVEDSTLSSEQSLPQLSSHKLPTWSSCCTRLIGKCIT